MKFLLFFAAFFGLFVGSAKAQDTLLLLSGKILEGRVMDETDEIITYMDYYRGDSSVVQIETYRVFSVKRRGAEERVLYTLEEGSNAYKPEEMRYYIYGEQDADRNFTAKTTGWIGFITGAAAGWFIEDGYPYVLAQPFVYAGINVLPFIRIKSEDIRSREMLQHEPYIAGFERVARNTKIQSALKGSLAGMAVGIAGAFLVKRNL